MFCFSPFFISNSAVFGTASMGCQSSEFLKLPVTGRASRPGVRVRVRGGWTYFHTRMHARKGCQACGLMRVGGIRVRVRVRVRVRQVAVGLVLKLFKSVQRQDCRRHTEHRCFGCTPGRLLDPGIKGIGNTIVWARPRPVKRPHLAPMGVLLST